LTKNIGCKSSSKRRKKQVSTYYGALIFWFAGILHHGNTWSDPAFCKQEFDSQHDDCEVETVAA